MRGRKRLGWSGSRVGQGASADLGGRYAVVLFPMAVVVIGLNRIMPLEGGLYVWARRAFGGLGGFLRRGTFGFMGLR